MSVFRAINIFRGHYSTGSLSSTLQLAPCSLGIRLMKFTVTCVCKESPRNAQSQQEGRLRRPLCCVPGWASQGLATGGLSEEAQRRGSAPVCTSTLSPSTHVPSFFRRFRGTGRRVTGHGCSTRPSGSSGMSSLGGGGSGKGRRSWGHISDVGLQALVTRSVWATVSETWPWGPAGAQAAPEHCPLQARTH